MARHRAVSNGPRWRRSSAQAVVAVPRLPGIEVVDARTLLAHQVSPDELLAGRQRGNWRVGRLAWAKVDEAAAALSHGEIAAVAELAAKEAILPGTGKMTTPSLCAALRERPSTR